MFGRKKRYETYADTRVEMDPETGMPLVRGGGRWEVEKNDELGREFYPLRVRLLDRDGRALGMSLAAMASREAVRGAAVRIAANRIENEERAVNIARLVGTYPPKTLN